MSQFPTDAVRPTPSTRRRVGRPRLFVAGGAVMAAAAVLAGVWAWHRGTAAVPTTPAAPGLVLASDPGAPILPPPPSAGDAVAHDASLQLLNYAQVSLHRITSSRNRAVLEQEYSDLVNNLNLSTIKDREGKDLVKGLLDALTSARLVEAERERQRAQAKADHALRELLYDVFDAGVEGGEAVTHGAEAAAAKDPVKGMQSAGEGTAAACKAARAVVGYFSRLDEAEGDAREAHAQLDDQQLRDLNQFHKQFIDVAWDLEQKYNLSDDRRLRQDGIEKFVDVLRDADAAKRERRLVHLGAQFASFRGYPPYWYYLGSTEQELGHADAATRAYAAFDACHGDTFTRDPFVVTVCTSRLLMAQSAGNAGTADRAAALRDVARIEQNVGLNDWQPRVFAARAYERLGDRPGADHLLQTCLDDNLGAALCGRVRGEMFLRAGRGAEVAPLVAAIARDDSTVDHLFLAGLSGRDADLAAVAPELDAPWLAAYPHRIVNPMWKRDGWDGANRDVLVKVPQRWQAAGFRLSLDAGGQFASNLSDVQPAAKPAERLSVWWPLPQRLPVDALLGRGVRTINLKMRRDPDRCTFVYDLAAIKDGGASAPTEVWLGDLVLKRQAGKWVKVRGSQPGQKV